MKIILAALVALSLSACADLPSPLDAGAARITGIPAETTDGRLVRFVGLAREGCRQWPGLCRDIDASTRAVIAAHQAGAFFEQTITSEAIDLLRLVGGRVGDDVSGVGSNPVAVLRAVFGVLARSQTAAASLRDLSVIVDRVDTGEMPAETAVALLTMN